MTPTWAEMWAVWGRVAALSFGGPAAQIGVMHRIVVDERKWVSPTRFAHALNFCMLLPGPEAMQLATFLGWWKRGVLGGLLAGGLFVLPGFVSLLCLSALYVTLGTVSWFVAALVGFKAAVLPIVAEAVHRIGKKVLRNDVMRGIACVSFVIMAVTTVPFPLVVAVAAGFGAVGARLDPARFVLLGGASGEVDDPAPAHTAPSLKRALVTATVCTTLWWAPVATCWLVTGPEHVLTRLGLFFSKVAMVTFGGAYAVLGYVGDVAVNQYRWVTAPEMVDGLGMAESTPGPLIQVVQFVGFLAAWRNPGALDPWVAAIVASLLVTWVTYTPCFLWVFTGGPWVEALARVPVVQGALSALTAAVVGVVARLGAWFALHVLFSDIGVLSGPGPFSVPWPNLSSFQPVPAGIAVLAGIALHRFGVGVTLIGSAILALAVHGAGLAR